MPLTETEKKVENKIREKFESIRWLHGVVCPHCQSKKVMRLQGKSTRPGVYKCKNKICRKQFTVTIGTIFEDSHIPLTKWVIAFSNIGLNLGNYSAVQLSDDLKITYKSAWFMYHRIRYAMQKDRDQFREDWKNDPDFSDCKESDEFKNFFDTHKKKFRNISLKNKLRYEEGALFCWYLEDLGLGQEETVEYLISCCEGIRLHKITL